MYKKLGFNFFIYAVAYTNDKVKEINKVPQAVTLKNNV